MLNGQYFTMSVNGASTICGFVSTVNKQQFGRCDASPMYWQPLWVKEPATCSLPHPENERQESVNDV